MNIKRIETKKDAIKELKSFYISMYKQKQILLKKKYHDPIYMTTDLTDKELQQKLDDMLNNLDSEDEKIESLKKIIDAIFEDLKSTEIKEKLSTIGKEYYDNLIEKVERARGLTDEEIIIEIIDETDAKIHEDKSEKEGFTYGNLLKIYNGEIKEKKYSYEKNNKKYNLYPIENYKTYKHKKDEGRELSKISSMGRQYLTKFRLEVEFKPGRIASTEFFADSDLEKKLDQERNEYFLPMLAAISKTKKEENQYIGHIECIYKDEENDIETFVREKDENLENSVKKLVENELKEQSENENVESKDKKDEGEKDR